MDNVYKLTHRPPSPNDAPTFVVAVDICRGDNAPLAVNDTYGSQWQMPENILLARFVKFGAQLTW